MSINRAQWSPERILAFKKYLQGDTDAKFRGKNSNGQYYKSPTKVAKLIEYYKPRSFSVRKGHVYVTDEKYGSRRILTDKQVATIAVSLYRSKEAGVAKTPSIYNLMKTKYVNVSYNKVKAAIQGLASYQKFEARHVKKPRARKIIVSTKPGAQVDTDVMYFSKNYYRPSHNEGFDALVVCVDRFSGYIGVQPLLAGAKKKTADIVGRKVASILKSSFPSVSKGGELFHDNGVEMRDTFPSLVADAGYKSIVISKVAGAPSAHAENAVRIIRRLVNTKLTADGRKPAKLSPKAKWWPMARNLVASYNKTPQTDARSPHTPEQLARMSSGSRSKITKAMNAAGAKRLTKVPSRTVNGARVSKQLKVLSVGDSVRYALENIRKTGANKRPYPSQRWSDEIKTIQRVVSRKLGFASYVLSGLPRRRFEREDLQKVAK